MYDSLLKLYKNAVLVQILLISLPFEFLGPVPGEFMVGAVGDCTLQLMARTNHKFPGSSGRMFERKRNQQ